MKKQVEAFVKDERGEFGIKQIAATVAVIVVIGLVIGVVRGNIGEWVGDIWDKLIGLIDSNISSGT
ncbi:hypothetical protein [Paenibacillus soyae]|uniref:Uncharacterized protein n=1 Tax=Paenibacillus soyae TaxID=2969249 RepID=A0A9X2S7R5_9BACL|nr:hypothetical protein [Paenibacillus soyae]MCR2803405.1 hypothetical protein [Paenibacillus soyae]